MCLEERVFFRLISGLHTSITVKIAAYYHKRLPIPQDPSDAVVAGTEQHQQYNTYEMFSPNLDFFEYRIAPFEDRLKNMYFLYSFTLRYVNINDNGYTLSAIQKASKYLLNYNYDTGNHDEKQILGLMSELVSSQQQQQGSTCHKTFDESVLFTSQDKVIILKNIF